MTARVEAMVEVRNLTTYLDEAGQCRVDEPSAMVALVTNGTPFSEAQITQLIHQLHLSYGSGWKSKQWLRRDVIRLTALIRAKGWLVLQGFFKPPGDLESVARNFADYVRLCPLIQDSLRDGLIREANSLQSHIRVWLLALYDVVKNLHTNEQVATGQWIFHTRSAPTESFLAHYLDFSLGAQNPKAWEFLHTRYRPIPIPELFKCTFRSDHEVDGLRIVDYCAHFFLRTLRPFGDEAMVDMAAYQVFRRVLETPMHHEDVLPSQTDIQLWIETVAELFELAEQAGFEAAAGRSAGNPYQNRVWAWMLKTRFLVPPPA